jgi:two-component system chemotaxis response regulator CheY
MKTLIVEDDFTSRKLLQGILSGFGHCDIAVNGVEAVDAFRTAVDEGAPYDLICMDIMMPYVDGFQALRKIRRMEAEMDRGENDLTKVIMVTAVEEPRYVFEAFEEGRAVSYIIKPIEKKRLLEEVRKTGLIP